MSLIQLALPVFQVIYFLRILALVLLPVVTVQTLPAVLLAFLQFSMCSVSALPARLEHILIIFTSVSLVLQPLIVSLAVVVVYV